MMAAIISKIPELGVKFSHLRLSLPYFGLKEVREYAKSSKVPLEIKDRMLRKILKKKQSEWDISPTFGDPVKITPNFLKKSVFTRGTLRRAQQLSTVYYKYITDIINSGELHSSLAEKEIFISKVTMSPDFSELTVKWLASGTEEDEINQEIFECSAWCLRSILTGYNVTSRCPRIVFVPDYKEARLLELDRILAAVDKGPPDEIEQTVNNEESNVDSSSIASSFQNDILDLDHSLIMKKIISSKKKTSDRSYDNNELDALDIKPESLDDFKMKLAKMKRMRSKKEKLQTESKKIDREAFIDDYESLTSSRRKYDNDTSYEHLQMDYESDYYDDSEPQ
ncbi:putative ribosome-binding factor A, mitochondrial [Tubulanus polymorphus]|uniref:putative ribosome-binding factor A, mitochondrial n=1 Tax=Tubulanus polymorphus TaxID=672921 RepID=UPI003DA3F105